MTTLSDGRFHFTKRVTRDQNRSAGTGEGLQELTKPRHALGVESVRGFVEHEDLGITEHRGGKDQALAHPEREGAGLVGSDRSQTDHVQHLRRALRAACR